MCPETALPRERASRLAKAALAATGLALVRLLALRILPQVAPLFSRPPLLYPDLVYYQQAGTALLSGGLGAAVRELRFVANPLWSVLITVLCRAFGSFANLWWLALCVSTLRDGLLLYLFAEHLKKHFLVACLLMLALPHNIAYALKFTSDVLASLSLALFLTPFALQREGRGESLLLFPAFAAVLSIMTLVRSSLLPFAAFTLLTGAWAIFGRGRSAPDARPAGWRAAGGGALLLVSSAILLGSLWLTFSYFRSFAVQSSSFGVLSYRGLVAFFERIVPGRTLARIAGAIATPPVHLFSFVALRELTYLRGFESTGDFLVPIVNLLILTPALIAMARRPLSLITLAFAVLFLPSAVSVAHARYSFPMHSILAIVTVCAWRTRGVPALLAGLDIRAFFSRHGPAIPKT